MKSKGASKSYGRRNLSIGDGPGKGKGKGLIGQTLMLWGAVVALTACRILIRLFRNGQWA
jgi:hypothetical protein